MSDYQHIGIERTENGYVVQMPGSKLAFEEPEFADLSPEPHTTARMLRAVVEYFGAGARTGNGGRGLLWAANEQTGGIRDALHVRRGHRR